MQALENIYKQLSFFFSNLLNTLLSIIKIILQSGNPQSLPQSQQKSCIILGNGPSLGQSLNQDRNKIQTHTLFCVNSFALTTDYESLKPSYYVMHDPGLWLSDSELSISIFKAIQQKTTWPIIIYIPRKAKNSVYLQNLQSDNIKIIFYNYTVFKGFDSFARFFYKKNLAMPQSQNVLVACLFLAINMNFKEIFILGADHTWHENLAVNNENVLCIKDIHYYDTEKEVKLRPFYKGLHLKETFKVYEIFEAWAKVFKGYAVIENYAKYCHAKIYNASLVSFIDVFERRNLK